MVLNSAIELRNKDLLKKVLNYEYVKKCNIEYLVEYRNKATELTNKL